MDKRVKLAIIGAGTAGLSAYKEASKYSKNIVLIDHGSLGTTCARVGCMPSKVLIQVAKDFYQRHYFAKQGISGAEQLRVHLPEVLHHVRKLRDYFTQGVIDYTLSLGDQLIRESAHFIEPNVLQVGKQKIIAERIIIATGSQSRIPNVWHDFQERLLTSDNIFEQQDLPTKLAVIGLGVIGLELGQALARLGLEIQAYHSSEFIGGLSDPEVNKVAVELMRHEFAMHLQQAAELKLEGDSLLVSTDNSQTYTEKVLAALGRVPNLDSLDLANVGVQLNDKGIPVYNNKTMQIGDSPIFIAGDVDNQRPLLHEAADEGRIAGYNAMQTKVQCFKRRVPLAIVFSQPNIAAVGSFYRDLPQEDVVIGEVDYSDQGRARIGHENKGKLRIYANKQTGQLLGAEMIAPAAEHLAHLLAWGVQQKLSVFEMLQLPYYHPVIEEGMRTALRDLAGKVEQPSLHHELALCDSAAVDSLA